MSPARVRGGCSFRAAQAHGSAHVIRFRVQATRPGARYSLALKQRELPSPCFRSDEAHVPRSGGSTFFSGNVAVDREIVEQG
jgi:hypothetical protein